MGQKTHPTGFRVGIIEPWVSTWFAKKGQYALNIAQDAVIRKFIKKKLYTAGVSRINIARKANNVNITVVTAKPGIVIGAKGSEIEKLRKELEAMTGKQVNINIQEVKRPEADAQLVAEATAAQLVRRVAFRRAMKQAVGRALKSGAEGVKIALSGRLAGADIARTEWYSEGKVPLHTLRADIDYGFAEADTTYGKIGVKVWIYKGEVLPGAKNAQTKEGGN